VESQKVFDQVKSLLDNFRGDIQREEVDATVRCKKEEVWVNHQINLAIAKLARRTKDVNDLKAHIKFIEHRISETNKSIKHRQDRIAANLKLLEQFKKERCENNLLFVKSLREHIEGLEIFALLRQDIIAYFKWKRVQTKWVPTALLERFEEFEHLLDEEHKLILSQLKVKLEKVRHRITSAKALAAAHGRTDVYTKVSGRTAGQIGTGHVDNTRGELKKLAVPGYETIGLFLTNLEKKVLLMIDQLILHLKNSRDALTRNEIKAAEDFAIFQKNMFKENAFLKHKIAQLNKRLVRLKAHLAKANKQLVRRLKLKREAEIQLANFRRMKAEKLAYCKKEHVRRLGELANVDAAKAIFQNVLNKLSLRVKLRAQSKTEGKAYGKGQEYEKHVRIAAPGTQAGISGRQKSRSKVVFAEEDRDE
jgi:hypothetical protein